MYDRLYCLDIIIIMHSKHSIYISSHSLVLMIPFLIPCDPMPEKRTWSCMTHSIIMESPRILSQTLYLERFWKSLLEFKAKVFSFSTRNYYFSIKLLIFCVDFSPLFIYWLDHSKSSEIDESLVTEKN